MKPQLTDVVLIGVFAATAVITGVLYEDLPSEIAVQWALSGEVRRTAARWFAWITAGAPAAGLCFMLLAPKLDPRRASYEQHKQAYLVARVSSVSFLIAIHWIILLTGLGYDISAAVVVKAGAGMLFVAIGSVLSQVHSNHTFGIRLPWTLDDEVVWRKTHRLGGVLLVLVGLVFVALSPVSGVVSLLVPLVALMISLLTTAIYAYRMYQTRNA